MHFRATPSHEVWIAHACAPMHARFIIFANASFFARARALTRTMHVLSILRATVSRGSAYDWKYEFLFLYVLKKNKAFDFKCLRIFRSLFLIIIFANASYFSRARAHTHHACAIHTSCDGVARQCIWLKIWIPFFICIKKIQYLWF